MPKPDKSLADVEKLLVEANKLLKKNRIKKKICKKCNIEPATNASFCKSCFLQGRKEREELRIGKVWISTDGYERIYDEEGKIQLHHRYIIERAIGRRLLRTEKVMWKNGDRTDNRIENLLLSTDQAIDFSSIVCPHCNEPYAHKEEINLSSSLKDLPSKTVSPETLSFTLKDIPSLRLDINTE